jgi:hypothetical protein
MGNVDRSIKDQGSSCIFILVCYQIKIKAVEGKRTAQNPMLTQNKTYFSYF